MKEALLEQFLHYLATERQLSPHTLDNYSRDLNKLLDFTEQQTLTEWSSVEVKHIRQYVAMLHRKDLAGSSIQRSLSAIRSFYNFLSRESVVEQNPAAAVQAPKSPRKLPSTLDVDQMGTLLDVPVTDNISARDAAMMELMYSSGLRVSELVAIDLYSLDLSEGSLRVVGKGRKERELPIGRKALEALDRWLDVRHELANYDENALFVSKRGSRITVRSVQQRMDYWGKYLGVNGKVHPHRLRHSFASHILESSSDLRAVQELLGHEDISTTQIYTHLDFQHLMKVYEGAHPRARKKSQK
ncbi:tyrosine recombinase XerC [Neptuniibacter sp. QD72_48]|uniref:tyrosine recombinase XerC n=1 Tax=unclassified Neptuniibacter TaxID=2630693 RepID=UPI0039F6AC0E